MFTLKELMELMNMDEKTTHRPIKHKLIYDQICDNILKGTYKPGQKLPTENELAEYYSTSRPTIGRAMRELQQKGLIVRYQGQGTFVKDAPTSDAHCSFGVLVHWQIQPEDPKVATIFGSIVPEILKFSSQSNYSLLLNDLPEDINTNPVERAQKIVKKLVDANVAGVFFTPLELVDNQIANENIAKSFDDAGIALVLLDRDLTDNYHRSKYDVISINNEQAAMVLVSHLVNQGCNKIDFIHGPVLSTAVDDRIRGYHFALEEHDLEVAKERVHAFDSKLLANDPGHPVAARILENIKSGNVDALVCVNDSTAVDIMLYLMTNGVKIPKEVKIVGFDDLPISQSLPVPLTTMRQPVEALAYEAVRTMLNRLDKPELPARDIFLKTDLVVRKSCGSKA